MDNKTFALYCCVGAIQNHAGKSRHALKHSQPLPYWQTPPFFAILPQRLALKQGLHTVTLPWSTFQYQINFVF